MYVWIGRNVYGCIQSIDKEREKEKKKQRERGIRKIRRIQGTTGIRCVMDCIGGGTDDDEAEETAPPILFWRRNATPCCTRVGSCIWAVSTATCASAITVEQRSI